MSDPYDCTEDVKAHQAKVRYWLHDFAEELQGRATVHDKSKLESPEKEMFDQWTPELRVLEFGSEQYKQSLAAMGEGLQHHYRVNRHHPEHYPKGVDGMSLWDVVEMVCDWMAVAEKNNVPVDLAHAAERFHLAPQLVNVIYNTFKEIDFIMTLHNCPVTNFAQEKPPEDA